jgi:hypothetical protein
LGWHILLKRARSNKEMRVDPEQLQQRFASEIAAAPDLAALDAVRVAALGKAGEVTAL